MADWRMLTCAAGLCGRASARSGCASTPPAPRPRPSPAARITAHSRSPAHTQRRNATVQTLADHSARQLLHITHSWHTYRPSPALCNGICDYKPSQQMSTLTWSPVVGCFMCQLSCPYSGANGSASSTAFGRMCGMRCRRMSSRRIGSSFAARPPWRGSQTGIRGLFPDRQQLLACAQPTPSCDPRRTAAQLAYPRGLPQAKPCSRDLAPHMKARRQQTMAVADRYGSVSRATTQLMQHCFRQTGSHALGLGSEKRVPRRTCLRRTPYCSCPSGPVSTSTFSTVALPQRGQNRRPTSCTGDTSRASEGQSESGHTITTRLSRRAK